jgi:hypothetical protein
MIIYINIKVSEWKAVLRMAHPRKVFSPSAAEVAGVRGALRVVPPGIVNTCLCSHSVFYFFFVYTLLCEKF